VRRRRADERVDVFLGRLRHRQKPNRRIVSRG
jgi:hypothetical protein